MAVKLEDLEESRGGSCFKCTVLGMICFTMANLLHMSVLEERVYANLWNVISRYEALLRGRTRLCTYQINPQLQKFRSLAQWHLKGRKSTKHIL